MKFVKVSSSDAVAEILANKISSRLAEDYKILWFVTGGSGIKLQAQVSKMLKEKDLSNLVVILMDERFGVVGHEDSNWKQIIDSGFDLPGATLIPILTGDDREKTTEKFKNNLSKYLAWADYKLGQFGIGPDGHTAGILPESPNTDTPELAVCYEDKEATQQFTEGVYRDKDRITLTAKTIAMLDEAIVFAMNKPPELFDKLEQNLPIEQMPAQALKQVPQLTIYNDYKGEPLA